VSSDEPMQLAQITCGPTTNRIIQALLPVCPGFSDSIFMNLLLVPVVHHLNYDGKVYVDDFLLERGFFSLRGDILRLQMVKQ
jgi:hypothetical protein